MNILEALVLGLIEGLTEYLPVSSTGHLLVAQRLMGIAPSEAANAFAIAIQAGAIVAVLALYRGRVFQIGRGMFGRDPAGLRLLGLLLVAFLPAAVFGLLFDDAIEAYLFGPWPIIAAWAAGGVLILVTRERFRRPGGQSDITSLSFPLAFGIGLCQCAALWPGTSRSLATIFGALMLGLSMTAALEFSFLLGLITLGAATGYKTLKHGAVMLEAYGPLPLLVGFLAAWISAMVAVRWMVGWLSRNGLGFFGWWRLLAAAAVSALIVFGSFSA